MEVRGKLIKKLELETGTSKSGKDWKKQIVIIDNGDEFNNITAVSAFGDDKIKSLNKLEVGMKVAILCNVYSREYNGKYYHNIDGYHFTNQSNVKELGKNAQPVGLKQQNDFVTTDDNDMPF
tara:strand:+ start:122 stop:487 length:366 start_codon:yes stop_codon:yes gene_type:complete